MSVQFVSTSLPAATVQPAYTVHHAVPVQRQLNVAVKETRTLSILQIVIGSLSVLFGILTVAILSYWGGSAGFGIWTGLWIVTGGGLGMGSASNPNNGCLNGAHMAFNIISCCLSFIDFIIFAVGISYFKSLEHATCQFYWWSHSYDVTCKSNKEKWRTGVALFTLLLLLMLAEFVIALTASIYCCKAGCTGCCDPASPGVIIQQPQPIQQHTVIQTSGAPPYSNAGHVAYSNSGQVAYSNSGKVSYSNSGQVSTHQISTGYNSHGNFTVSPGYAPTPAATNVIFAQGVAPPPNPDTQPPPPYS